MPTIMLFGDSAIVINPRDHFPPHFHVIFRDGQRCSVTIDTFEIIAGSVKPTKRLNEALVWAKENRELLRSKWEEIHR
jgi:uncharacterized protein DUF4160